MGFKVILTPQSLNDLEEIVAFIAKDNPDRARTFGNELIDRALSAAFFPERGRVVPEIGGGLSAKSFTALFALSTRYSRTNKRFTSCVFGMAQEANRKSAGLI